MNFGLLTKYSANTMKSNTSLDQSFPKVGIRPTIDGRRRGVRESLEKQVMNMANLAAKLPRVASKAMSYH